MKQVKLATREQCAAIREAVEGKRFVEYAHVADEGVWGAYPALVNDGASVRYCRCCGFPIKRGSRMIPFTYEAFGPRRFVHEGTCRWGAAHDEEPMKGSGASNEAFRRASAINSAKHNKQSRDAEFANQQAEFGCIARSPVTTRFVDPATLRRDA